MAATIAGSVNAAWLYSVPYQGTRPRNSRHSVLPRAPTIPAAIGPPRKAAARIGLPETEILVPRGSCTGAAEAAIAAALPRTPPTPSQGERKRKKVATSAERLVATTAVMRTLRRRLTGSLLRRPSLLAQSSPRRANAAVARKYRCYASSTEVGGQRLRPRPRRQACSGELPPAKSAAASQNYQALPLMFGSTLNPPAICRLRATTLWWNVGRVHYSLTVAPSAQFRRRLSVIRALLTLPPSTCVLSGQGDCTRPGLHRVNTHACVVLGG